jgi:hypothetical protein
MGQWLSLFFARSADDQRFKNSIELGTISSAALAQR